MAIGGMHPVAHKKHWNIPRPDARYPKGAMFRVCGDSRAMWIQDYSVRVSTVAEVLEQPKCTDKKVLVRLAEIDHDSDVSVYINKKYLLKCVAREEKGEYHE